MTIASEKSNNGDNENTDSSVQTIVEPKVETRLPSMYKVILMNDDYTPMDFVVSILVKFFRKTEPEATNIMLQVHEHGRGIAGVFPYELAETKVFQVQNYARLREYPLKCVMEKD